MLTLKDINGLSNIHDIPKGICINKITSLDFYLSSNLSDSPRTADYDFDVYLNDYGVNLQRPYVWNLIQQQEFILSILLEKPIPSLVIVDIDTDSSLNHKTRTKRLVIDGKQRLLTIKRFLHNEFPISVNGCMYTFDSFDEDTRRLFLHGINRLTATVYYASDDPKDKNRPWYMSDDMKITLFNFYNFAGTQQEKTHKDMLQGFLNKN